MLLDTTAYSSGSHPVGHNPFGVAHRMDAQHIRHLQYIAVANYNYEVAMKWYLWFGGHHDMRHCIKGS